MHISIYQISFLLVFTICLSVIIFGYFKKGKKQKSQHKKTEKELQNVKKQRDALLIQLKQLENTKDVNFQKWMQKKQLEEEAEAKIRNHLSAYYYKRESFMNKGESRIFFYINNALNEILKDKERNYYFLFPQVSLFSFINQTDSCPENEKELLLKIIGGKNVDFILCHCHYEVGTNSYGYHLYTPILMIEIDGPSHFSLDVYGKKNFHTTQKNDQFKNALANDLKLSLLRYRLSNGKISANDKTGIHAALGKFFFDYKLNNTECIYYYDQNGALSESQYYNTLEN